MKVLAVLSLALAVAVSYPTVKTMTLSELAKAIESNANPELEPFFEQALNEIVDHLFKGQDNFSLKVFVSPSGKNTWTIEELTNELKVVEETTTNIDYKTAVLQAYGIYKQKEESGIVDNDIQVVIPAMDISTWTLEDLKIAQKEQKTKAELLPYVEKAIAEIKKDTTGMVTPIGVLPYEPYF